MPIRPGYWSGLFRVGMLFAISITLQQLCYVAATVTNASFLICTTTVMTPLAAWLLVRERVTMDLMFAATLTVLGALLMANGLAGFNTGDLTALIAAATYAFWAVELGRHVQAHGRPLTAAAAQFLGGAAFAMPLGTFYGGPSLVAVIAAGPELLVLGVFSTAMAFVIQTAALRFTSASHAAVIVSAESIFGALGGAVLLGEQLSASGAVGGAMILGAILLVAMSSQRAPDSRSSEVGVLQPIDALAAYAAPAAMEVGDRGVESSDQERN